MSCAHFLLNLVSRFAGKFLLTLSILDISDSKKMIGAILISSLDKVVAGT